MAFGITILGKQVADLLGMTLAEYTPTK